MNSGELLKENVIDRKKIMLAAFSVIFLLAAFFAFKTFIEIRIPEMDAGLLSVSKDMVFGVTANSASGNMDNEENVPIDLDNSKKEIDYAVDIGANFIRINLKKENIDKSEEFSKLSEVISYARGKGLKIELAYLGRQSWLNYLFGRPQSYGKGKVAWSEFKSGYAQDIDFLIRQYDPDYMVILPQCPSVIGAQVSSEIGSGEWLNFAKEIGLSIKRSSFRTKVVIEGGFGSENKNEKIDAGFLAMVLENNDAVIDIASMIINDAESAENGTKRFLDARNKYHWHGGAWIGAVSVPSGKKENEQKDFLLYALHKASSGEFGGFVISQLRNGAEDENGIMDENYNPKMSYEAIKQAMKDRE